jgi:hypothetical protein
MTKMTTITASSGAALTGNYKPPPLKQYFLVLSDYPFSFIGLCPYKNTLCSPLFMEFCIVKLQKLIRNGRRNGEPLCDSKLGPMNRRNANPLYGFKLGLMNRRNGKSLCDSKFGPMNRRIANPLYGFKLGLMKDVRLILFTTAFGPLCRNILKAGCSPNPFLGGYL